MQQPSLDLMESDLAGWTAEEQDLARGVFDRARSREVDTLIDTLRRESAELRSQEDIWRLHDFLSIRRHAIEGRAEFRLPDLLFLFAAFVRDGLASLEELQGLSADKLAKISAMARF